VCWIEVHSQDDTGCQGLDGLDVVIPTLSLPRLNWNCFIPIASPIVAD
jgi:hypothetical protein